jgi:hypothetical protein
VGIVTKKRCKRNYGTWKDNPLYERWREIRRRCMAPSNKSWKHYGGRGIRVCEEWDSFPEFEQWAVSNGYSDGLHIDRIDVNKDYSPDNCRWVTNLQNQNNKRNNYYVTAFGETKTLAEWGRDSRCMVSYDTLCQRLNQKRPTRWSPEEAISTPSTQIRTT